MWASELEPPARLIVLALMSKADNDTAVVESKHTPSLSTLTAMTGLARSSVTEWLNALDAGGWVKRARGSRTDRTSYALLIGAPSVSLPTRESRRRVRQVGPPGGLAEGPAMSGSGSPPGDLVRQAAQPGSPPGGREVVRQADEGRPPGGHASLERSPTEISTPETPKSRRGTRIPNDFGADAEMIAWARENTPNVGAKETDAFIDYWRGISGQRGVKLDWPATWRNWMRKAQSDFDRQRGRANDTKPSTTDQRVAAALALAEKFAEQEST